MNLPADMVAIQCCETHWKMMRKELTDRGMDHLISKTNEETQEKFDRANHNKVSEAVGDPLLEAFMLMAVQIQEIGVPPTILATVNRECMCPVCVAMQVMQCPPEETEHHWTAKLADSLLQKYRYHGLMPRLQ